MKLFLFNFIGTLYVFKACDLPNSTVKRVVLTSSIAAIYDLVHTRNTLLNESDWPDTKYQAAYEKSKTLAEKAAWDFVSERKNNNEPCFELAVINPGLVFGPILIDSDGTSVSVLKQFLERSIPMLPDSSYGTCDVRQVALAHIKAMVIPEAVNNRHIIVSSTTSSSFKDYGLILAEEFDPKGYNVPTKVACHCLIKMMALTDKTAALIVPGLGKKINFDNRRMREVLKIEPMPVKQSLIDMANSLIQQGKIKK